MTKASHQFIWAEDAAFVVAIVIMLTGSVIAGVRLALLHEDMDSLTLVVHWIFTAGLFVLGSVFLLVLYSLSRTRRCPDCGGQTRRLPLRKTGGRQHFWCESCDKATRTGWITLEKDHCGGKSRLGEALLSDDPDEHD